MRIVLQRVKQASVKIDGKEIAAIGQGFLLLVGVRQEDTVADAEYLAGKISKLRVFEDEQGKMNWSLAEVAGQILSVSQFTLYAYTRKGNRPSFIEAAAPDKANELYQHFNQQLEKAGVEVKTGEFGADMKVDLLNDGPVTILFDTENK